MKSSDFLLFENMIRDFRNRSRGIIREEDNASWEQRIRADLRPVIPRIQALIDEWEQDEDGYDEAYGGGGICDDIAGIMVDALDPRSFWDEYDTHSMALVLIHGERRAFMVNLPASAYETGYGFLWKKRKGAAPISIDQFLISDLSRDYERLVAEQDM